MTMEPDCTACDCISPVPRLQVIHYLFPKRSFDSSVNDNHRLQNRRAEPSRTHRAPDLLVEAAYADAYNRTSCLFRWNTLGLHDFASRHTIKSHPSCNLVRYNTSAKSAQVFPLSNHFPSPAYRSRRPIRTGRTCTAALA
jgi:hypothetical protein